MGPKSFLPTWQVTSSSLTKSLTPPSNPMSSYPFWAFQERSWGALPPHSPCSQNNSGINVHLWVSCLISVRSQTHHLQGPAFCDSRGQVASTLDFELDTLDRGKLVTGGKARGAADQRYLWKGNLSAGVWLPSFADSIPFSLNPPSLPPWIPSSYQVLNLPWLVLLWLPLLLNIFILFCWLSGRILQPNNYTIWRCFGGAR